jgi:AraC-like DNA-binding protein/mannose-6-phosphate isomerase-like protein (cupin superfamily)
VLDILQIVLCSCIKNKGILLDRTDSEARIKRGYLNEDFRFFHLRDKRDLEFEVHYHDFNKIVIFLSGAVSYRIEGKVYRLKPWDILFVSRGQLHQAVVSPEETYERIVIWVNSAFLSEHNMDGNLLDCFELSSDTKNNLLRLGDESAAEIKPTIFGLEKAMKDEGFGARLLQNSLFLQLMIYLNRLFLGYSLDSSANDIEYDERIGKIIDYINANLDRELSIDVLSARFFISKYYLMHKFKKQTGYTVHNYVLKKRLIKSAQLIKKGAQVTETCALCGFGDYSNFERAFRKEFGLSPKGYYKVFLTADSREGYV